MRQQNPLRAIAGAIILFGIALAFIIGGGDFNLPVFFVVLAFGILIGSFSTLNPRRVYGGIQGFLWMLILALFFLTTPFFDHAWVLFLVGAGISVLLGALFRPIMAGLLGIGILGAATRANQPPQQPYQQPYQPYQPPQQPDQPPYQSYEQGYQTPPQPTESYQEGGRQSQYPQSEYEQPQTQYPQELPPQQ